MTTKAIGKKYEYSSANRLGQGAFAEVFKGQNKKTGETVAIKVIKRSILQRYGDDMLKQIHCEIEVLQQLVKAMKQKACPFINKIYECLETENHIYIVLEFCDGGTLLDVLQKKKKLLEKEAVSIIFQMVNALAFINENNTAHRDIKPENVFIKSGIYKLGDFGFAGQKQLYQTHLGTYPYMAPEFFNSKSYDGAIDVWALGCMFHEMLFGEIYFIGSTQYEVSMKILNKPYVIKPDYQVSSEVRDLLPKMVNKDKQKRITPKEMLAHPLFNEIKASQEFISIMENERIFMLKFQQEQEEDENESKMRINKSAEDENLKTRQEEEVRRQQEDNIRQQEEKKRQEEEMKLLQQEEMRRIQQEEAVRRKQEELQRQIQQEEKRRIQQMEEKRLLEEKEQKRKEVEEENKRRQFEEEQQRRQQDLIVQQQLLQQQKMVEDKRRQRLEQEKREQEFIRKQEEQRIEKENERKRQIEEERIYMERLEHERRMSNQAEKQMSYTQYKRQLDQINEGVNQKLSIIYFMTQLCEFLSKDFKQECRYDIFYIEKQLMVQLQQFKDKMENKVALDKNDHILFDNIPNVAWELYFEDLKWQQNLDLINDARGILLKQYIDYYNYMNNYTQHHYPDNLANIQIVNLIFLSLQILNMQFQALIPYNLYQPQLLSTIQVLNDNLNTYQSQQNMQMVTNCQKAILWLYVAAFPEATFSGKLVNLAMFQEAISTNNIGLMKQSINKNK